MNNLIKNENFINKHKIGDKSFTRKRTWGFSTTFLFISSFLNKRVQSEIDTFFAELYNIPKSLRSATSSSFTQCRDKISYKAFEEACKSLVSHFYENYEHSVFEGMRIVAVDGTVLTLPKNEETVLDFGDNVLSKDGKWIKSQVSFATDILSNICLDSDIKPYKTGECEMAEFHLKNLGSDNLYIFDRGYFGRAFLYKVYQTSCDFCFRVKRNACNEVIDFIKSEKSDSIEFIDTPEGKIKVRLSKVLLDTGEEEYLLSSLTNTKKFTLNALKKLYHLRWGVEEQYKDMKHAICVENFIGKKVNSIKQEFYATILTYNLAMMSCKKEIDKSSNIKKKKHPYQLNKRALLAKFKQCFIELFWSKYPINETLINIVKTVTKESVPIREGRKFPRGKSFKAKKKFHRAYVPVV